MAERLDGVLSELLAAQENEPATSTLPEEVPNTEPAAEGGNEALSEGTTGEAQQETAAEPATAPTTANEVKDEGGEVPTQPQPNQQIEVLSKVAQALNGLRGQNQQLNGENQQLRASLAQAQQMMESLKKAQDEANRMNEEKVAMATLEAPPIPDIENVQYMSDEERKAAFSKYGSAVAEYSKKSVMKDLQPIVDEYHRRTKEAADTAARNKIAASGRLKGFVEDGAQIDKIIAATPGLSELPPETKYALGYVINRGVKSMNEKPPAPETAEQLVQRVLSNPEAMKALEKERVAKIAASNKAAPPLAASQGQNNAPAVAPKPPSNLAEAREKALKIFGLK